MVRAKHYRDSYRPQESENNSEINGFSNEIQTWKSDPGGRIFDRTTIELHKEGDIPDARELVNVQTEVRHYQDCLECPLMMTQVVDIDGNMLGIRCRLMQALWSGEIRGTSRANHYGRIVFGDWAKLRCRAQAMLGTLALRNGNGKCERKYVFDRDHCRQVKDSGEGNSWLYEDTPIQDEFQE